MILAVHIISALTSLAVSAWLFVAPSRAKLHASYGLVAATLASGTYLVRHSHSPMVPACEAGLLYLGVVAVALVKAHLRLDRSN